MFRQFKEKNKNLLRLSLNQRYKLNKYHWFCIDNKINSIILKLN